MKANGTVDPRTSDPDADPDYLKVYGSVGCCSYYDENGERWSCAATVDMYPRWGYVTYFYHGKPEYPEFLFDK